ncbi:MAG: M60 family metallopeptidase [Luteolibacter sp.]
MRSVSHALRFHLLLIVFGTGMGSASPADYAEWRKLSPERQRELTPALEAKAFRKLPSKERQEISEAAVRFSADAIGRKPNGKLKFVRDETEKRLLRIAGEYLNKLPADKVPPHPRAADLFGRIPEGAQRVSRSLSIDPSTDRWHSTGLYAAPGEVVKVDVPASWIGKGIKVRLSGHIDNIPQTKDMARLPSPVSRVFEIKETSTNVASAFGGAIYIDMGKKPIKAPPFEVQISNALIAPTFKLGTTTAEEWRETQRRAPAPYAELICSRVAFSVPSEWVRDLDDPSELMRYWDRVVELHDQLGGMSHLRSYRERVNVDVQISLGLFHSGYPMQGPQDHCRKMVDLAGLREQGNWGWFHELGHEAQRRPDRAWGYNNPYTFDNSVEVTVNLFSSHAYDKLRITPKGGWAWTVNPELVAAMARKAIDAKTPYAEAKVGTRLAMYLQLRDAFGWEAIQAVLKSYSDDECANPEKLPKSDQSKRDEFFVRMSRAVNRDLSPFMQKLWGIEISEEAKKLVSDLKPWTPEGFPAS